MPDTLTMFPHRLASPCRPEEVPQDLLGGSAPPAPPDRGPGHQHRHRPPGHGQPTCSPGRAPPPTLPSASAPAHTSGGSSSSSGGGSRGSERSSSKWAGVVLRRLGPGPFCLIAVHTWGPLRTHLHVITHSHPQLRRRSSSSCSRRGENGWVGVRRDLLKHHWRHPVLLYL